MLRYLTSGESHGRGLVVIIEGMPAGVPFSSRMVVEELARRRLGHGRGPRMALESDKVTLIGGVRHGRTLGSPVSAVIENVEFDEKWAEQMNPDSGSSSSPLTMPRPGHADLAGMLKYDFDDARNVLERASARETAARSTAGALAKSLLSEVGVSVISHVLAVGGVFASKTGIGPDSGSAIDADPMRCADEAASKEMTQVVDEAREAGDTLGGVFEVVAFGVPVGVGSYVHWDRKLDALLAAAVVSVNAVKAVEIGDAWEQAASRGSQAHDEIGLGGSDADTRLMRSSNRAGGIEGGMATGEPIVVRGAMKPLASLSPPLRTVDMATGQEASALTQRTDSCAVPAAAVVAESMVALVIASEMLRKFGGDSLDQFREAVEAWSQRMARRQPQA
ncbi:MAG: chorismate synthase [Acidobacteria bacterium]|nr:MAG: chorismate synthase [Acidobacteriota bacterium]